MIPRSRFLAAVPPLLAALAACTRSAPERPAQMAVRSAEVTLRAGAMLHDASGRSVGAATVVEDREGTVYVDVDVDGLPAGTHGIHIHEVGECTAQGSEPFQSARGHFNPEQRQHGLENPQGPHAGDLPNLVVGQGGAGQLSSTTRRAALRPGPNSLLDADGSALVIHAGADDQRTDPSGNSGGRIACGVIRGR